MKIEKLLYNGKFLAIDPDKNIYSMLGITNGKIVYLSKKANFESVEANMKINMQGKTVLPGFIDSHLHTLDYAEQKKAVDLSKTTSVMEILECCKSHYNTKGLQQGWLIGKGWNQNNFTDNHDFIYKDDLDKISNEFPIILLRTCVHVAVVNSKALEVISKSTEGKRLKEYIDEEKGILKEGAVAIYKKLLKKIDIPYIKELILDAHNDFLKAGITQVHSADLFSAVPEEEWELLIQAYQELEKENKLKVKTYEQCMFFNYENFKKFSDSGYTTGKGSRFFRIGPLKLIADGSLGARSAYLTEPYEDDSTTKGILILDEEKMEQFIKLAKDKHMQLAIHTIGDGAAKIAVNLLNKYNKNNNLMRDGIVHAQILNEEVLFEMKKGDITAYIQPVFIDTDMEIVEKRIGKKRTKNSYIWKKMLKMGLHLSGGSDAPVVDFNVLENIYFAVTRKNIKGLPLEGWYPEEDLTLDEAIELFTIKGAYHSFEENEKGSLEIGKYADLVVLDRDIYEIPSDDIKDIKVIETIIEGNSVFKL